MHHIQFRRAQLPGQFGGVVQFHAVAQLQFGPRAAALATKNKSRHAAMGGGQKLRHRVMVTIGTRAQHHRMINDFVHGVILGESSTVGYSAVMRNDYDDWNMVKQHLQASEGEILFREGEVWWCHIGLNLGYELYGKGDKFWRPVVILQKHNRHTFLGLPMGSTVKENKFYYPLHVRGREGCVRFDQARVLSAKRLANRMIKLPSHQFAALRQAYRDCL